MALFSLSAGVVGSIWIAVDVWRHPQKMAVMNVVWPTVALFGHVFLIALYLRYGRANARRASPAWVGVAKSTLHCGAGCSLGDLAAEWLAFIAPTFAVALGWGTLFVEKTFAIWILDFAFAFGLGVLFQYLAIRPMRKLTATQALVAALKADTLSLIAWQAGMYTVMGVAQFVFFPHISGREAPVDGPEFWFTMQVAMLAGFLTSYPVNWWLIDRQIKEAM
jgi:hypothetical protein